MPIYEYRCPECGAVFARLRSVSKAGEIVPCPECDNRKTERLLSTFASGSSSSSASACPSAPSCGAAGGG